ncbi:lipase family protein [Methylocystis sp. SC2]|uniref:lipase family protein n=1 Tax=Methylocystis sp. (strain SC2) TaxID=187303 RepID=UPI00027AF395|nr:lipase family protein [Methylocystis sp. SC2]CCJ06600.1 Lipase class 3 [Methylocystis sp. SC2]
MKAFLLLLLIGLFQLFPAAAQADIPDYVLAYRLAVASYCAYAVNDLDDDHGKERARRCLTEAKKRDPERLQSLDVQGADIETYFDPRHSENAYLLARTKDGLILAFRGTLTPPIDPDGSLFHVARKTIEEHNLHVAGFQKFVEDWLRDIDAVTSAGRHPGIQGAWEDILAHLDTKCGREAQPCFRDLLAHLDPEKGEKLFITGHSKGGALATLAALDIANKFGVVSPTVYTFAAAKALTEKQAAEEMVRASNIWRFERADDLVPALAPDSTAFYWPWHYAHVGSLALLGAGRSRLCPPSPNGIYTPNDRDRIASILLDAATSAPINFLASVAQIDPIGALKKVVNGGEPACRKFVDAHFAVFSDVRQLARNGDTSGPGFFVDDLTDDNKDKILWGYGQWCNLVKFID